MMEGPKVKENQLNYFHMFHGCLEHVEGLACILYASMSDKEKTINLMRSNMEGHKHD